MPQNSDHIKITDTQPRVQYVADGSRSEFPFTFQIFKKTDLEVYIGEQKQSSNYTAYGEGNTDGGAIILSEVPSAGEIITLVRNTPIQRTSDFQESGMFQAKVLNDELDLLTAALQDVAENVRRSVKLAVVDGDANLALAGTGKRANSLLAFDADGNVSVISGAGNATADSAPGGEDTQVQFNDGGVFGGTSGLTYAKSTNTLSVEGRVRADKVDEKKTGAGVTVDGLLIKDGLIDGRDVSSDGAKLDGIAPNAIGTSGVTFETLDANSDIGTAAGQVAPGDHRHDADYSALDHDHDGTYAGSGHNHDTVYAGATHADAHTTTGSDPLKLDGLAEPDDTTNLDASTTKHGLLPKLSGDAGEYLDGLGNWSTPLGGNAVPGGADTQVQFNDGGVFGGTSGLTYAKSTNTLSVEGRVRADKVDEKRTGAGVTVDGLLIKDGLIDGRDVSVDGAKLDGIETGANATDATNVVAAGAVMNFDTTTEAMSFVIDDDTMATASDTILATSESIKAYVDSQAGGGNRDLTVVSSKTALEASTSTSELIYMAGYTSENDGGEGFFRHQVSGAPVDNGLIFAHGLGGSNRFHRVGIDPTDVLVSWFGAAGDGSTDDTAAINAALSAAGVQRVRVPGKTHMITAPITPNPGQTLEGTNWDKAELKATSVTGGMIAPYPGDRVTIRKLKLSGSMDYGIKLANNQQAIIEKIRISSSFGLTNDAIYATASWASAIRDISVWTQSGSSVTGESCIRLDGTMHGVEVSRIETSAGTRYGIVVEQETGERSSSIDFAHLTLQGHEVGLWLRSARRCTVSTCYFEATKIPIRLGDTVDTGTNIVTSVTILGGGDSALLASSTFGDNTTGVIEILNARGVSITDFQFDSVRSGGDGYKPFYLHTGKAVGIRNCTYKGGLGSLRNLLVLAPGAASDNSISVDGDASSGNEWIRTEEYTGSNSNTFASMKVSGGGLSITTWTPSQGTWSSGQSYPDPDYSCSLSRYVVSEPGTKQKVVQLRRSSDNDTRDFYLDSGLLKRVDSDDTLANWAGADTIHGVRWYNQADATQHMSQTDTAKQPTLTTNGIDGKPAWVFDGVTDLSFDIPDGWVRPYMCTAFIVAEHNDEATNDEYVLGSVTGGQQFSLEAGNGGSKWGWGLGGNPTTAGPAITGNNPAVLEAWVDENENGSSKYDTSQRVNKANIVSGQTAGNNSLDSSTLRLGNRGASTYYPFDGKIAEFISFHSSLSLTDRDAVSQAAMDQYSIS